MSSTEKEIIHSIRKQLPQLLRRDPSLRDYILAVAHDRFPTRVETEDRFTRMLNELRRNREEQNRKWEAQDRKWEEQNRKWEEQKQEDKRKWEAQDRKWEEQNRKWEEQRQEDKRKWEAQGRKWEEQKEEDRRKEDKWERRFDEIHKEIMAQAAKHDRSIGALGSRWGLQSEKAFRDALAAILVKSFDVDVVNVNEFDHEGEVFGRPDQVELDVIIKNGLLIICELKSSVDKPAMYAFERKVRFYEKRHQRQADRLIVISPMIDDRARRTGEKLGIEMYLDSLYVPV
uniref:PD-(D/E)XK nuclease superfamily protein n=1 Tax=Candidatus Kentrum sp. SD TaxID=2126332 RepID=A0A450YEZ9_9GAMM|nr:MAG: hypothetical protein BECKSD772F_GA0070984_105115 [Candidatus Kentron sp. SD]VFK45128.1 MAG: hypothetical protein BECKSD772E_GA0070983_10495 [Candidatus Kentron sp. SD]